ncbi:MAG: hypothetical protein LBQ75_05855 [Zoogloeaceae bacterium]|nr:hypothetical protein [Zoogloeaceae bacterium]
MAAVVMCCQMAHAADKAENMKIEIVVGDKKVVAILEDSEAARDFASLLPLTFKMKDYNRTEKISDLPRKLATNHAPAGYAPKVGDITTYTPWGNLNVFYRDFGYSTGLVKLGHIESGIEVFAKQSGDFEMTIRTLTKN